MVENNVLIERERIRAEYRRRDTIVSDSQGDDSWFMVARQERERYAWAMLRRAGILPLRGRACLEVGFGHFGWLNTLISLGARESDLHGIDLNPERVEAARCVFPTADLRAGDAAEIPWQDGTFHIAVASTVFTSILSAEVRHLAAREIIRILAPGGALLWYDFRVDNPRNPNVRRVTREELKQLFPTLSGEVRSITLAMPLLRWFAPRSWMLTQMLSTVPFLRTHLIAVLRKP
jgi:ubiquinone/menaquinone biosynthesis C-methylase UbiE